MDLETNTDEVSQLKDTSLPDGQQTRTSQKGIFKDVLKLVFGTGTGQVIIALSAPVLTRFYTPEAIGISSVFFSIVGIVNIVVCLRYELAIPLASSDDEAANLLAVSLSSSVIISAFVGALLWLIGPSFCAWINMPSLQPFLWLIPANLFANGIALALNYWNTRFQKFSRLAVLQITNAVVTVAFQIILGFQYGAGEGELIIGSLIGTLSSVGLLVFLIGREGLGHIFRGLSIQSIFTGIKRYKKFPLLSSWAALLNTISWQLPTFMLSQMFSPTISGYYSLGNRVLRFPMSLIGGSIGQAQYPRLIKAKEEGSLALVFEESLNRLVGFSLIPLFTFSFVGQEAFVLVFGSPWAEAGIYTQILCIWMIVWFISGPLSNIFFALEKQHSVLILQIVILVTRFLSLWIGGLLGNPRLSIILFSISGIIVYGYLCFAALSLANLPAKRMAVIIWKYLKFAIPILLIMGLAKIFSLEGNFQVAIAFLIVVIYFVFLIVFDKALIRQFSILFKGSFFSKFTSLIHK